MNKKILLVGWGYPPDIDGGLDIHVKHLFDELQKRDVEVDLAVAEERAPDREDVIGVETGEGDMVAQAREMSSEIASLAESYDIIHTHDWFGAEAGFKARKYSSVKWVSTLHSLSSNWSRNESGWKEVEDLEEVAAIEPDKLLAVSKKLAKEIEEEHGVKSKVIHNGFSVPETSEKNIRKNLGIDEDMIFFVGRHAEQKGIEHLLYGFRKFLEDDAELVIGGDGYMRESLVEFAEMLEIEEKVHFVGYISSEELGDYYSAADLFVSPSINEPFGLTITESLESGTPVLATENGVSEVSSEFIIETSPDSEEIAKGIKKGLKIDSEVEVESRTWEEMAEEVMEIYSEV